MVDIRKAGAVIIRDRKVLMTRTRGKEIFVNPGGKLEEGETSSQALIRELGEELGITVAEGDFEPFGTFHAQAAYDPGKSVTMDVFLVHRWKGEIVPQREIEELAWIDSKLPSGVSIGSIMQYEVLPRLRERGMID